MEPTYDGTTIEVLEGLQAVRKRPGMYVGGTGPRGLLHLLIELLNNAAGEAVAGHATRLRITRDLGAFVLEDDGRGAPIDDPRFHMWMTQLHAGPARHDRDHVHLSPMGMGLAVVNALCSSVTFESWRTGRAWRVRYADQAVIEGPTDLGPTDHRGTRVTLHPDPTLFSGHLTDAELHPVLQRMAWTTGARVIAGDTVFHAPDGLLDALRDRVPLYTPARRVNASDGRFRVQLAWCDGPRVDPTVFVNGTLVIGGTFHVMLHDLGLRHCWLHVVSRHVQYGGRTRERVDDEAAGEAVMNLLLPHLA